MHCQITKKGANLNICFEVNIFKRNVLSVHVNSGKGLTITFIEQLAAKVEDHSFECYKCVCEKVV